MNDRSGEALVVFSRYPRLGRVKTRLASTLTDSGCLKLHTALLQDTLERTAALAKRRFLYLDDCSAAEREEFSRRTSATDQVEICLQQGKDLGERLSRAFQELSPRASRIVFIGTDSPSLPLDFIAEAFVQLRNHAAVFGPARDGGYYLIGLSRPLPEIFEEINWGTPRVLKQTLSKLRQDEYLLLPAWYDIDEAEDLAVLKKDLEVLFPGFPHRTWQFLQGLKDPSLFRYRS